MTAAKMTARVFRFYGAKKALKGVESTSMRPVPPSRPLGIGKSTFLAAQPDDDTARRRA